LVKLRIGDEGVEPRPGDDIERDSPSTASGTGDGPIGPPRQGRSTGAAASTPLRDSRWNGRKGCVDVEVLRAMVLDKHCHLNLTPRVRALLPVTTSAPRPEDCRMVFTKAAP